MRIRNKIKKFFIYSGTPLIVALPLTTIAYKNKVTSNKVILRERLINTNDNNHNANNHVNNFELKVLLNYKEDMEDIINFNQEILKKITQLPKLKYKSYEKSNILPVLWFYFENENDRSDFISKVHDMNEINKIINFKNSWTTLKNEPSFGLFEGIDPDSPGFHKEIKVYNEEEILKFIDSLVENLKIHNYNKANSLVDKKVDIGILEYGFNNKFLSNYNDYFLNSKIEKFYPKNSMKVPSNSSHSTLVSLIAGGDIGTSNNAKIYLSIFESDSDWWKAIEWLVLEKNVKIINHSYGNVKDNLNILYEENAFYIDYIAKKYGVINLFASGNGEDDPDKENEFINGESFAFNSIVVGALSKNSNHNNIKNNKISYYSNYKKYHFPELAKPLVVSPGTFWNPETKEYSSGTSFASPVIAGLISEFLSRFHHLNINDFRVPIIKSILSSSSITSNNNINPKSSGFDNIYGAGTPDFKKMIEAAGNLTMLSIPFLKNKNYNNVYEKEIYLKSNQNIKIASSWIFNSFITKNNSEVNKNDLNNFYINGLNENPKKYITDFNLGLEYFDNNFKVWRTIKILDSEYSNDELLEYKVKRDGKYRIIIKKKNNINKSDFADDKLAVTYVVHNEN